MPSNAPAIVCELCDGTGWKHVPGPRREVVRCDCVQATRLKFADGVPLEFRDARLDNYREQTGNKSALKAAKTFLASVGDLVFIGPVGCGKTRLACSILNEHHQTTRGGLFLRVPKLLLDLQLLMFGGGKTAEDRVEERAFIDKLFSASLLVLDDLGVEKGSEYTNRTLYTLYEERCDRGLRTIWTTNLSFVPEGTGTARSPHTRPPTLGEQLGDDRLPSRLAGRATVAYLSTRDQRLPFNRKAPRDAD
jgi:DNA replication protein DnaC